MAKKTPQLRICVTPECNLHCKYCMPGGEGYSQNLAERMTTVEIINILRISVKVGFSHIKFTGGEPLMRNDIEEIIAGAKQIAGLHEIQLVTNGTLLSSRAEGLKSAGLDVITVSLDSVNPDKYSYVRGGQVSKVFDGLKRCRDINLPIRINTVLMKYNQDQVEPLMRLAHEMGASLKFLDLINLPLEKEDHDFWQREYLDFDILRGEIEKKGGNLSGYEEAPGGIGAPLQDYLMPNGLHVVIKDSTLGTFYEKYCFGCSLFPCQDALISLRITHDGNLKMCLLRNDNLLNVLMPLREGDLATVEKNIKNRFDILAGSKYYPKMWKAIIE